MEAEGKPVPAGYTAPPELFQDLMFDWSAFVILSGSRQVGMGGACAIPVSEIVAYCELIGITDSECRVTLLRRIQILDGEYLKIQAEKSK